MSSLKSPARFFFLINISIFFFSTTDDFSQTINDAIEKSNNRTRSQTDSAHSIIFEPTEIDYLKRIILAYMTGTDRLVRFFSSFLVEFSVDESESFDINLSMIERVRIDLENFLRSDGEAKRKML